MKKLCYVQSFLTLTDEWAIVKLGLKTGAGSSHGKSVLAQIRFFILHSVCDFLGRLATASERTVSIRNLYSSSIGIMETYISSDCVLLRWVLSRRCNLARELSCST